MNTLLMLELLKAPFVILLFSYYNLLIILMMLYVILPLMLKMLVSPRSMIRSVNSGSSLSWVGDESALRDNVDLGK